MVIAHAVEFDHLPLGQEIDERPDQIGHQSQGRDPGDQTHPNAEDQEEYPGEGSDQRADAEAANPAGDPHAGFAQEDHQEIDDHHVPAVQQAVNQQQREVQAEVADQADEWAPDVEGEPARPAQTLQPGVVPLVGIGENDDQPEQEEDHQPGRHGWTTELILFKPPQPRSC